MTDPIRIALAGCGMIGKVHAQRLALDSRATIVGLADPQPAGMTRIREEFYPRATEFRDAFRMLEVSRPDGIIIASPTQNHFALAKFALERNIHVLCEKPLALQREEIVDLLRTRDLGKAVLSVSYQRRYLPPFVTAKRELADTKGRIGKVHEVHVFVCERWQQTIMGTWRDDPAVGAGYFFDAGSHQVDSVFYCLGTRPTRLFAVSRKESSQVEIVTSVLAELNNGSAMTCHFVGNAHHWRDDIHFHGRNGDLLLRSDVLCLAQNNQVVEVSEAELAPKNDPDRAFIDAILEIAPTESPAEGALLLSDWTNAVLESSRRGEWITLDKSN